MKYKSLALFLALALSAGTLLACKQQPPATPDTTQPEEVTQPQPDPPETEDTTDYDRLSAQPFDGLTVAPASDFTYTESDDGTVTITGYTGTAAKLLIPETIADKPVVGIGDGAFRDLSNLTVLSIPDSVTVFGSGILVGCSNLYALRTPLPTEAGKVFLGYLFGAEIYEKNNMPDLRNLDFLELGGSLTELPAYSLYDCNDLVCVRLPDTVISLGEFSLYRCQSLKYINAGQLTRVGDHALDNCQALTDLVFGASLTEIGLGALENCRSLRNLTLPFVGGSQDENRYLGYLFGAEDVGFSKGFYPSSLRTVTLLPTCTEIADYAFYECFSLRSVDLGQSVTSIGVRAFSGCVRLRELTLPDSLLTVRENAFTGCTALASVSFGSGMNMMGIGAFSGCTALTEVKLPESLTALPNSCFSGCRSLQTVELGGVTVVGSHVFHNCPKLAAVHSTHTVRFEAGNEDAERFMKGE